MSEPKPRTFILWRIVDGRSGHDNQSRGLARALGLLAPCLCHNIRAGDLRFGLMYLALRRYPPGEGLPDPDLIIGAGHATHLSLLCAKRARGGRTVVIMKPGLPLSWFDVCLIPEHDEPPPHPRVCITRGALTALSGGGIHAPDQGVILVGGPSRHCRWDNDSLLAQIRTILECQPRVTWHITDSPRTPPATRAALDLLKYPNGKFISHKNTDSDWVSVKLSASGSAWVSADSLSMIYESLSSGAATGVLSVPTEADSKIGRSVEALRKKGMITCFADWDRGARLTPPAETLNEAERCARFLLDGLGR